MATVPRLPRYYQGAKTTCIPSLRLIDSPAGTTSVACLVVVRSRAPGDRRPVAGPGLRTGAPSTVLSRWRMQVLPGFLAVHPVALRRSSDPGRPCRASPLRHHRCCPQLVETEGTIGILYRGSITPLHHPLCTLHDVRCRTPCNTDFRPVGCTFTGQESNLLDCGEWFPLFHKHPPFQDFAWRNDNQDEKVPTIKIMV